MPSPLLLRRLSSYDNTASRPPIPMGNISFWLRDDVGVEIDETGTPSVSRWNDQSPNQRNALSLTKSSHPLLTTDGITFDGVDDLLVVSSPLIRHFFAVFRSTGSVFNNAYAGVINSNIGASNTRLAVFEANQTRLHSNAFPSSVRKNGIQLSSPFELAPVNVPMVISIVTSATSSTGIYRLAGLATSHAAISIRELICYTSQLSADDVTSIESYLMQHYSIS